MPGVTRLAALGRPLLKRLLWGALVLWLISVAVFVSTELLPGNAAQAILGRNVTPQRLAALEAQLHLQGSAFSQYLHWTRGAIQLNFGTSLSNNMPVSSFLLLRLENTVILMVAASVLAIPVSLILGAVLAYRRNGILDNTASVATLAVAALPEFVSGTILIIIFSTGVVHVLPATSSTQPVLSDPAQLILPSLTLALAIAPYIVRMMRATMIEVFESEYVLYARVIGIPEREVIARHALPNAFSAVLQVTALQLAFLAGGVVVVEYLFQFPGLGAALVDSVNNRDLPVLQAISLFTAAFYIVVNLLADAGTLALNPRARRPSH
jgi:peptide/nickel transport system permease protein